MPGSKAMVDKVWQRLATDHPDYLELSSILHLASHTWPKFGISAAELSQLDPHTLEMIKILIGV
jgi:hypothetical protein